MQKWQTEAQQAAGVPLHPLLSGLTRKEMLRLVKRRIEAK